MVAGRKRQSRRRGRVGRGQISGRGRGSRRLATFIPIALALATVYLPASTQQEIANVVRSTVLRPFVEMRVVLIRLQAQARDFESVQSQMDSSMAIVARHRTLAEENRQLRGLLGLREREWTLYVPAAVVRSALAGSASVFRFGAGRDRGIHPFTAVVSNGGLFGQILEVHSNYSLGIDWSHPDFRVGAMSNDGRHHGLVEVERGEYRQQDRLVMRGVPFLSELASGTRIVTSGRGGVFPRGIPVGSVVELAETRAGWSRSYYIDPAVQPGAVTHGAAAVGVAEAEGEGGASPDGDDPFGSDDSAPPADSTEAEVP